MYAYLKALHIIFIVTWFAGMFYIVRLFIYNREANDKAEPEKKHPTKAVLHHDKETMVWYYLAFSYSYFNTWSMGNVSP